MSNSSVLPALLLNRPPYSDPAQQQQQQSSTVVCMCAQIHMYLATVPHAITQRFAPSCKFRLQSAVQFAVQTRVITNNVSILMPQQHAIGHGLPT
jgi:hypothetical protein